MAAIPPLERFIGADRQHAPCNLEIPTDAPSGEEAARSGKETEMVLGEELDAAVTLFFRDWEQRTRERLADAARDHGDSWRDLSEGEVYQLMSEHALDFIAYSIFLKWKTEG